MRFNWLITGSGYSAFVLAERIASQLAQRVLIVERRDRNLGDSLIYGDIPIVLMSR